MRAHTLTRDRRSTVAGWVDCVEALLAAGADLALRFMQLTPLGIAQQMGNMDMTRCLERAAADRLRDGLTTASSRSSYASASTQARQPAALPNPPSVDASAAGRLMPEGRGPAAEACWQPTARPLSSSPCGRRVRVIWRTDSSL